MRNEVVAALKSSKNCSSISANRSLLENSLIMNKSSNNEDNMSVKLSVSQKQLTVSSLPPIRNNCMESRSSNKTKPSVQKTKEDD